MQLKINYNDGSLRVINVTPTFFQAHEVSWEERAMHLAYDTGKPTFVEMIREGETVMSRRVWKNIIFADPTGPVIDERQAKKELRRQFKHIPFTVTSRYQL